MLPDLSQEVGIWIPSLVCPSDFLFTQVKQQLSRRWLEVPLLWICLSFCPQKACTEMSNRALQWVAIEKGPHSWAPAGMRAPLLLLNPILLPKQQKLTQKALPYLRQISQGRQSPGFPKKGSNPLFALQDLIWHFLKGLCIAKPANFLQWGKNLHNIGKHYKLKIKI